MWYAGSRDWQHNNKYLTKPTQSDYSEAVKQYGEFILKLMDDNKKVVVLDADLIDDFNLRPVKERHSNRFIECGISEQHMVSMANGLALAGKIPICHTFGAFYRRALDQIYNNACDRLSIGYIAGLCRIPAKNIGLSHRAPDPKIFQAQGVHVAEDITSFFNLVRHSSVYLEVF